MKWAIILLVLGIICQASWAEVKLPAIISNNMVLQADKPLPIWGTADPGEKVTVTLAEETATAIADAAGNIDNVSMERPDGGEVLAMFFSVQVRDRRHLAHVMRALKRIPEVRRIQRART